MDGNTKPWVWSDLNGNGRVEPNEIQIGDDPQLPLVDGFYINDDLSVTGWSGWRGRLPAPAVDASGNVRYDLQKLAPIARMEMIRAQGTGSGGEMIIDDSAGNIVVGSGGWGTKSNEYTPIQGYRAGQGLRWLQGYYGADYGPPRKPGQIVTINNRAGGFFGFARPRVGESGPFVAINSDKGAQFLVTTDGFYLQTLGGDMRTFPLWRDPKMARRGAIISGVTFEDEQFYPSLTQMEDGTIYMVEGKEHSSIVRLEGLDSVRRHDFGTLTITPATLASLPATLVETEAQQGRQTLLVSKSATAPVVDGDLSEWTSDTAHTASIGSVGSANLRVASDRLFAAWRTNDANLLAHADTQLPLLFKTGGALDLMVGPHNDDIGARGEAIAGDTRLLITRIGGATKAVLYKPVSPGAPVSARGLFESPIGRFSMDEVRDVSAQVQLAQRGGNYEISVPLALLGLNTDETQFAGDVGVLLGDGQQTIRRVYWNNLNTAIVSDVPSEARLQPGNWGVLKIAP